MISIRSLLRPSSLLLVPTLALTSCGTTRQGLRAQDAGILCESRLLSGNQLDIFKIDYDGSDYVNLTNDPGDDRQPAYNANVGLIAFASNRTGDWEIWLMDRDGAISEQTTDTPGQDLHPSWGPNGARLVVASDRDGDFDIWKMTKSGGRRLQLTDDPASDSEPSWSGVGNRIAFTSNRTGDWEIFAMDSSNGANLTRLTQRGLWDDVDPVWSPDGTQIAFESVRQDNSDAEIFVMNADGSGLRNLTNTPLDHEVDPAWSQDGTKIAFARFTDNAQLDIYTVDVQGGTPRQVTTAITDERSPAWFAR